MRYKLDDKIVFRKAPTGPLVPYLGAIVQNLRALQYSTTTINNYLSLTVRFSQWLDQQNIELMGQSVSEVTGNWQAATISTRRKPYGCLKSILEVLLSEGVIFHRTDVSTLTPIELCLHRYQAYLFKQRNLTKETVSYYVYYVRRFLQYCFGSCAVHLCELSAQDVTGFARAEASRLNCPRTMRTVTTSMRSFLRYVHGQARHMPDLAGQVPKVASPSFKTIPRAIAPDEVEKLLRCIDRGTAIGKRNYAILLLLSRLGLRAIEVSKLSLDDFDWKHAAVTVTLKGGRRSLYPLSDQIGQAIVDYLQHARPQSSQRRVFLRTCAPFHGISTSSVRQVVRSCIELAGVESPTKGPHQFRHGLATQMLRCGAALDEIGDVLGHRDSDTTRIYVKVDISALRKLALPWPGVNR